MRSHIQQSGNSTTKFYKRYGKTRRLIHSAALLATALLLQSGAAQAQNYPEILFVFDSSGSMLETAGSTTKIAAAKKIMTQIVPELRSEIRVGLIAYGHRRKGDCRDIEVLIRPGSIKRDELLQKVQSLQPRGLTPITDAVSMAIDMLKLKENETTIILVSDGKETCHADPCSVVKKLKATGIKFVLHVVGFQVDQQAKKQLECLAKAGGGKYFHANNSDGLLESLQEIEQELEVKVEKASATPVTKGTGLGKIELSMVESSLASMKGIEIIRVKDEKVVKKTGGLPATSMHPLLDGEYEVHYLFAQPNYGTPTRTKLGAVKVERGQTAKIAMGAIEFNVAETFAKKTSLSQVMIVDSGTQDPVAVVHDRNNGYYNYKPKAVLPGVYDVKIQMRNSPITTLVAENVSVAAGKRATVTIDSGMLFTPVAATAITGWDLIPHRMLEEVNEGEGSPDAPAPVIQARPPQGNTSTLWMPYPVPPGHYRLLVYVKGMDEPLPLEEDLEIKAGQLIEYDSGL